MQHHSPAKILRRSFISSSIAKGGGRNDSIIKQAPVGYSWTTLLFPTLPALFRGDFKVLIS